MTKWAKKRFTSVPPVASALAWLIQHCQNQNSKSAQLKALNVVEQQLAALTIDDFARILEAAQQTVGVVRYHIEENTTCPPDPYDEIAVQLGVRQGKS